MLVFSAILVCVLNYTWKLLPPPQALRFQLQNRWSRQARSMRNWGRAREGSREGESRSFPLPFLPCAPTTFTAREMSGNEAVKTVFGHLKAWMGFEHMTSAIPVQCSTNWAIKPSGNSQGAQLPDGLIAQFVEHWTGIADRPWIRIPFRPEYSQSSNFTTAQVAFMTVMISDIFISFSAVHTYIYTYLVFGNLMPLLTGKRIKLYLFHIISKNEHNHGRSQDFSKGGSHWLIQRLLNRLSPEYCGLFAYKMAYKGGSRAPQDPPWLRPW